MKKIYFLLLLFFANSSSQIFAQKIIKETCKDVQVNDKFIQQVIITGDENVNYFTEFEKGKGINGITSIAKYDKDMHLISRFLLSNIITESANKKDVAQISIYPMKDNFLIVRSANTDDSKIKYSIGAVDYSFNILQPLKELYTTNDEYKQLDFLISSKDSTQLLFIFDNYKFFSTNKSKKQNIKVNYISVNQSGKISSQDKIEFTGIDSYDNTISNVLYLNNTIYFGVSLGYQDMTNYNLYGIAKKNESQKYNYLLYQYSTNTKNLKQILQDKNAEDAYLYDNIIRANNGKIYLSGSYTLQRNVNAQIYQNYDGHYVITIDAISNKVLTSNFMADDEKQKGNVSNIYFKEDGGYYLIVEHNYTNTFSSSDNMYIYNFDNFDKLLWKKVIEKQHQGGNLQKGASYLYSIEFVKKNDLYVLMNESKKNAELPIDKAMEEFKNWEKGDLYCIAFIYGNNSEKKQIVFNSKELDCNFYTNNPWYFTFQSKYMTNRLSCLYINFKQNKIYSIGGVDDERKVTTLKIE